MKIRVQSASDIGAAVRSKRKEDGLTLVEASGLCNVNYRFLSDLENGKSTMTLHALFLQISFLKGKSDGLLQGGFIVKSNP